MQTNELPEKRERPAQAFILGWPLANLGGVNEVVRNLAREFANSGSLTPLVIEAIEREAMNGEAESTSREGIPTLRFPFPLLYDARCPLKTLLRFCLRAPAFFRQLSSVCRRHDVQILNPHFISLEHLTLLLFRWLGYFRGRIILSFHGSDIRSMLQSRGIERFLYRLLLRGADRLIPCSQGLGEEILLLVPDCADRIFPVPNGIDVPHFVRSATEGVHLPVSFGNRRRILNVGAFEYKKGHDVLLKAFGQVNRQHPDTCLIIAGQTRERIGATRNLIAELGLKNDVLLFQDLPHNDIAGLLADAHLFVLSSRWEKGICGEGFAMALLEAAASQKPVVSTLSCGVTELIVDGESGAVVAPDNPEKLAGAILAMLDNPFEAARQAKNLHQSVLRRFTWAAAHRRYLSLNNA